MSISGSLRSRLGMLPACHTLTGRRSPWKIQSSPLPEAGQTSAPELLVVGFGDGGGDQGMAGTVRRREAETGPGAWAGGSLRVPNPRRLKRLRMEAHALYVVRAKRAFQPLPEPSGVERAADDDGATHVVFRGGSAQERMAQRISGPGTGRLS